MAVAEVACYRLRLALAGLPFEVGPHADLSPEDRKALASIGSTEPASGEPAFSLEVLPAPPFVVVADQPGPAAVTWAGERVRISHARMAAELDILAARGGVFRTQAQAWPLEVTLRVALCARLPLCGGLPLHAAGIALGRAAVAFFGPSGAGKSTLASTAAPGDVLSDELVALLDVPSGAPRLAASGFWGSLGEVPAALPRPLAALVALEQGTHFGLQALAPRQALVRLLAATLVPLGPPLWSAVLRHAAALVRQVPVFAMQWAPASPPWAELRETLRLD